MVRRTVSHKITLGANGLIRITFEFQMTDINPRSVDARNTWLAAGPPSKTHGQAIAAGNSTQIV